MTAERRLTKVEGSLTPTQRILGWLDEAHSFGSLSAYVDALLDEPAEAYPINRLAKGAASAARAELGRKPPDVVDGAVRKALRATIFRFELVMRINVTAHETIEREALIYAALAGQIAMLVSDDRQERLADSAYLRQLALCRDLAAGRVVELLAAQDARAIVEGRYLEGRAALFPDGISQWAERLQQAGELAAMADRIAELDGVPPAAPTGPEAIGARAARFAADLTEPARSNALEKLDEGLLAHRIATGWLRSKLQSPKAAIGLEGSPVQTEDS